MPHCHLLQVSQCKAPRTVAAAATHEPPPLSAEEMLVESQLVALGLLEPRDMAGQVQVAGDVLAPDSMVSAEAVLPVPRAVKAEIQRLVQTLQSYIERAHGLRIQVRRVKGGAAYVCHTGPSCSLSC